MKDKPPAGKQFSVPTWVFDVGKVLFAVAMAVGVVYARIATLEERQTATAKELTLLKADVQARAEGILSNRERISNLEFKSVVLEKGITESLQRIEESVREVRQDVKEMQKKGTK